MLVQLDVEVRTEPIPSMRAGRRRVKASYCHWPILPTVWYDNLTK